MIINNITQIPPNSAVVEYVFAFDFMLGNYAMFSILLALLIVMIMGIYYWRQDFIFALTNSSYTITIAAFIMVLIKSDVFTIDGNAAHLLTIPKFTFFLFIMIGSVFYEKVSS